MASRISALDATVRALGAEMGEWNDMAVAFGYPSDPHLEHDAIREAVGMWDSSILTKIQVRGRDSLAAVDYLVTRDMSKIPIGKSAYCPILKDDGHFCDDAIIFHVAESLCGGEQHRAVARTAAGIRQVSGSERRTR